MTWSPDPVPLISSVYRFNGGGITEDSKLCENFAWRTLLHRAVILYGFALMLYCEYNVEKESQPGINIRFSKPSQQSSYRPTIVIFAARFSCLLIPWCYNLTSDCMVQTKRCSNMSGWIGNTSRSSVAPCHALIYRCYPFFDFICHRSNDDLFTTRVRDVKYGAELNVSSVSELSRTNADVCRNRLRWHMNEIVILSMSTDTEMLVKRGKNKECLQPDVWNFVNDYSYP